jgi:hypothetical protein
VPCNNKWSWILTVFTNILHSPIQHTSHVSHISHNMKHMWKTPWRITFRNWQHPFITVCLKQTEQMETCRYCLSFWCNKCTESVKKKNLHHEPFKFLWCKMRWMGKHIRSTCMEITLEKFGTKLLYLRWNYTLQVPLYFLSIQDVHK